MRLLQLHPNGTVTLAKDLVVASAIPPYAILSHTWGADVDEVTFEDLTHNVAGSLQKPGYDKIRFCGEQARRDGLQFFWVDSCCINKANYSELSQAINSMFRWYQNASKCYVYLSDVSSNEANYGLSAAWQDAFKHSRWFTRGWTLQELIAPSSVEFFSRDGTRLGSKESLGGQIHAITGIAASALQGTPLDQFTINERISWAARRETTIEEDQVYCVLGIFGVHIPLIYGEGAANAMRRLRKEIRNFESELSWPSNDAPAEQTSACIASLEEVDKNEYMSQILGRSKHGCTWIAQNSRYRAWLESNESCLLWITAKAGCGKTTLAAHISELVGSKQRSGDSGPFNRDIKTVVLTFFFQRSYQEAGQTSLTALKTFAAQLARQQPATLPVLLQRYKRLSAEGGFTWSWANMSSVFGDMLRCLQPGEQVFVILDAIDECETDSAAAIVEWIDRLVRVSDRGEPRLQIKLLATSRPDGMLLDTLNDVPTLAIQESDTANDMEMFIDAQVEQFAQQRQLRQGVSQSIARFLKDNAQGMFLWVVLIMKELERRDARLTDAIIAQRLSTIPLTLVETYTKIIQAPPLPRREDMWRVIRWMLYGSRALTLDELEIGLCLEDGTLNWHGFAGDLEFLCGSLIRIDGPGRRVGFVHQTARSFLESYVQSSRPEDVAGLLSDARSSHEQLALACIRCLSDPETVATFNHELLTAWFYTDYVRTFEAFFQQQPFSHYAIESWAQHVRAAGPAYRELDSAVYDLFSTRARRQHILRLYFFIFKQKSPSVPEAREPLHLAVFFNLPQLTSRYISEDVASINSVSDMNDTPLIWACEMGSTECVRLLLDAGADPNKFENDGWSALHWAARNDYADVAELLLNKGANAEQRDSKGNTPLDWAVDREHWGVIKVFQRWGLASQTRVAQGTVPEHSYRSEQSVTSRARKSVWKLWDYRP